MNDLTSIPAYLMRGGTSKGLIFHKKDLPSDRNLLTENLLKIMGSPDLRQINGLGGGTSSSQTLTDHIIDRIENYE